MELNDTKQVIYELAYLLRLGESEAVIESILKDAGAEVKLKSPINPTQLAYPINKQESALFGFYQFTLPTGDAARPLTPEAPSDGGRVKTISDALKLKEVVMRFLFVKVPKKKPTPAPRQIVASPTTATREKKTPMIPSVGSIDALSNEKLEQTLEEILK